MGNALPRVYGKRARMALMVPSPNTVAETEFWRLAGEGVTIHTSRMPFFAGRFESPFDEMERQLPRVIDEVNSAQPDVVAYGCTASSAKGDPAVYEALLTGKTGVPTVTAAGALIAALKLFGARRIALITPYPPAVNRKECRFFAENGITVAVDESVIVDQGQMQFRNMNKVPPEQLAARAEELGSRDDVDAVVLSCCDMPTLDAIPRIEAAIGKPTISSTQALFWSSLRAAGIEDGRAGCGCLLVEDWSGVGPSPGAGPST